MATYDKLYVISVREDNGEVALPIGVARNVESNQGALSSEFGIFFMWCPVFICCCQEI